MEYKELLKDLRQKTGLTQTEFGNKLGVGLQTIQKYEAGEREPNNTIKKLIPYVFGEYIDGAPAAEPPAEFVEATGAPDFKAAQERIKYLENEVALLRETKELQATTIQLLKEQIQIFKDKINFSDQNSA